jgi:hypothetical protein
MAETYKFPDEVEQEQNAASQQNDKVEFDIEGDVDIEVKDDTPEQDRGYQPATNVEDVTDEELESYGEKVRRRIKEISHKQHDERRAKETVMREREELEKVARTLVDENKRLKQYVSTGEQAYAGTLKSAAEAEYEVAKKQFKEAHEAFDADAMIEAQAALTTAQMRMEQAKNFKPTPLQDENSSVEIPQTVQASPRADDKTLRWQARNQWFGNDEEMTASALVRHKQLVASGVDPRSDEYFAQIDAHMKQRFSDVFKPESADSSANNGSAVKKSANVVAPVQRSTGAKKIVLTKTQVSIAKRLGVPLDLYAKQVAAQESANG